MSFQKILVPYDGSRFADKALANAIGIAKLFGSGSSARIILLHVTPYIPVPLTFEWPILSPKSGRSVPLTRYMQELSEEMEADASKMLKKEKQKYEHNNIKVDTVSLNGYPPDKIIEFANNQKVDLIVIGSVGLSRLSKIKALGSVSRSERAACPVLIVH